MAFITKESSIVYEENGAVLAEVCFPEGEDGTVAITRTFVDEALRGQGMAGQLMQRAAEHLRAGGKRPCRCAAMPWHGLKSTRNMPMFWPANNTGHSKGPAPKWCRPFGFSCFAAPHAKARQRPRLPGKALLGTKRPVPRTENAADSFFRHAVSAAFSAAVRLFSVPACASSWYLACPCRWQCNRQRRLPPGPAGHICPHKSTCLGCCNTWGWTR